ncbi:MAG: phospholipase D-like domain-containing protein [Candidatus Omnitrophota bacterium]|nr:phospholipase D-like domain-containing protein [Candidatus Omnitrophota bacterium]
MNSQNYSSSQLNRFINLSLSFFLLFLSSSFALTVDIADISDNKYFDVVNQELKEAKKSIYVAMYSIYIDPSNPQSPPSLLLQDLIDAKNRGLTVKVYLDKSIPFGELAHLEGLQSKNEAAYWFLSQAGVDVWYVVPNLRLHDKLIIIDEEIVISGSPNWSYSSLTRNSENADLIRSPEYAGIKLENLNQLKTIKEPPAEPAYLSKLRVSNGFLLSRGLAPRMVNRSQNTLFDLYLFLLKEFQDRNLLQFSIDYEKTAPVVGLSAKHWRSPYEINRLLRKLSKEYKLIKVEFKRGSSAKVRVSSFPQKAYLNIPYAYWDYGWNKKLSLRAKFMYLLNIYKQETSDIKPWWSLARDFLSKDFHTSVYTITRGMRELERYQIVDIWRGRLSEKPISFADKPVNKYLLKPLLSPESIERSWQALEEIYGRESVSLARKLAGMIDDENNPQVVEKFVVLIKAFGYDWTEAANKITAKLSGENPARNVYYSEGILKRWSEQGHMD